MHAWINLSHIYTFLIVKCMYLQFILNLKMAFSSCDIIFSEDVLALL